MESYDVQAVINAMEDGEYVHSPEIRQVFTSNDPISERTTTTAGMERLNCQVLYESIRQAGTWEEVANSPSQKAVQEALLFEADVYLTELETKMDMVQLLLLQDEIGARGAGRPWDGKTAGVDNLFHSWLHYTSLYERFDAFVSSIPRYPPHCQPMIQDWLVLQEPSPVTAGKCQDHESDWVSADGNGLPNWGLHRGYGWRTCKSGGYTQAECDDVCNGLNVKMNGLACTHHSSSNKCCFVYRGDPNSCSTDRNSNDYLNRYAHHRVRHTGTKIGDLNWHKYQPASLSSILKMFPGLDWRIPSSSVGNQTPKDVMVARLVDHLGSAEPETLSRFSGEQHRQLCGYGTSWSPAAPSGELCAHYCHQPRPLGV